jgi:hypothetical protein
MNVVPDPTDTSRLFTRERIGVQDVESVVHLVLVLRASVPQIPGYHGAGRSVEH